MTDETLVTGVVHLALIAALATLPESALLTPNRAQRWSIGAVSGLAAVLITLLSLQGTVGSAYIHPTALTASAFLFGPLVGFAALLTAMLGQLWIAPALWGSALGIGVMAIALGSAWKYLRQRLRQHLSLAWPVVGVALSLPLVLLPWLGRGSEGGLAAWLLHSPPWHYVMSTVVLCGTGLLLRSRAYALRALHQRETDLHRALSATGGGRWEWEAATQRLGVHGNLFRSFGIWQSPHDDDQGPPAWLTLHDAFAIWRKACHPDDLRRLMPEWEQLFSGAQAHIDCQVRLRNVHNQWRWVMVRGDTTSVDVQGRMLRVAGMVLDITESQAMREAAQASEIKYTSVYQTLPDAAGITRLSDGRYLDVNPAFERLLGRSRHEVLNKTSLELQVWPHAAERERMLQELHQHGVVHSLPMTAQRRHNQGQEWEPIPGLFSARKAPIDGQECLVFVFHDIRHEQRMREELRTANSLLRQAGRMARLGSWEHTPGQGITYWSETSFEIHGLEPGDPIPVDYAEHFLAPTTREAFRAALRRSLRELTPCTHEYQITRSDGQTLWVRMQGESVLENGRVLCLRGVVQDIDGWRRTQEQLHRSENRWAQVFHMLPYAMGFSACSDGTYVDVNPAWEKLLGYSREQVLGRTTSELGIVQPEDRQRMLAVAREQGDLMGYEINITTQQGEQRTILQSMTRVESAGQDCWLFAVVDITERQRAEQRVREREELLSLTIAAAALGRWDWDAQRGEIHGDARWHSMHGLAAPTADPLPALLAVPWASSMATRDVEAAEQALKRHIALPEVPFDVTYQAPAGDGTTPTWVRSLGKIVSWDANHRPVRMVGMSMDVTSQRTQEEQLERLAHYDALTGLPNRVLLRQRMRQAMEKARRQGHLLGVVYLDLDGFKPVNDTLGHAAGDRLLVQVAQRLQHGLSPEDTVARLGGDEFVLLLSQLGSATDCEQRLAQTIQALCAPYVLGADGADGADTAHITASMGYTLYPDDDADGETLLRHADQAMYSAKQAGRNRCHAFDAEQERAQQNQREQAARLTQALERGELRLHLQPKVDMQRGAIVGAEALVRWHHPQRGELPPSAFLDRIEDDDELQTLFGEWVVDSALELASRLHAAGLVLGVSFNITPVHLHQDGFAHWMAQRLADWPQLSPALLTLELTESAALYDVAHVARELTALRALGMRISLDDFGTGYSSLSYLRRLPLDYLKLDGSFVNGMVSNAGDRAIVHSVLSLADTLGYQVIAEGVETLEQGLLLLRLGCTLAQGFYIAKPMALDEFITWVQQWQGPPQWQMPIVPTPLSLPPTSAPALEASVATLGMVDVALPEAEKAADQEIENA